MEYDLTKLNPNVRYLDEMREVLYDKEFAKNSPNIELYYMYRGIEEKNGLRYDITVIPAKMLGSEFIKTKGHYHIGAWQEIYIILEGQAIFLMQKKDKEEKINDAYAVKAERGNCVIIPPFYGHVTINPSSNQELKMANWISSECKSEYSDFEKLKGACYYYILSKNSKQAIWIKNKNYKSVPELRFENPLNEMPTDLTFLKKK